MESTENLRGYVTVNGYVAIALPPAPWSTSATLLFTVRGNWWQCLAMLDKHKHSNVYSNNCVRVRVRHWTCSVYIFESSLTETLLVAAAPNMCGRCHAMTWQLSCGNVRCYDRWKFSGVSILTATFNPTQYSIRWCRFVCLSNMSAELVDSVLILQVGIFNNWVKAPNFS